MTRDTFKPKGEDNNPAPEEPLEEMPPEWERAWDDKAPQRGS